MATPYTKTMPSTPTTVLPNTFTPERATLVLVDIQPALVSAALGGSQVVDRATALAKVAALLDIPILATTQNAAKLGGLHAEFEGMSAQTFDKMAFSAAGADGFLNALKVQKEAGRDQVFLVGFEAHICIALTAFDLAREGFAVGALSDAVASRTEDRYSAGIALLNAGRIAVRHSESLIYEWLGTADHPKFREALAAVKASRY